ncbi:MAG TPA: hypothetical protein VKN16_23165 [Methylomirabilota bacterium]|jgi:hypothetical protein|nr:hypothetical protein [Methylomirabilota bacterium]
MDPIWTQADIDALKIAIKSGVLTVTFGNRTTTFHSLREMRELLADMVASVNAATGQPFRLAATSKGV